MKPDRAAERRLIAQGLGFMERISLLVMLRKARSELGQNWQLVDRGNADVLLHCSDNPDTVIGITADPTVVAQLVPPDHIPKANRGRFVRRPLNIQALFAVLLTANSKHAGRTRSVANPALLHDSTVAPQSPSIARPASHSAISAQQDEGTDTELDSIEYYDFAETRPMDENTIIAMEAQFSKTQPLTPRR